MELFPEIPWQPWRFTTYSTLPSEYWDNLDIQKSFFHWVETHLKFNNWTDWYKVSIVTIRKLGGRRIMDRYGGYLPLALLTLYPSISWSLPQFGPAPKGFWNNIENRRKLFDWIGAQLCIKEPEDWYKVRTKEVRKILGGKLIQQSSLRNSLIRALITTYPEYPWKIWKFSHGLKGFWKDKKSVREYINWLGSQLNVKTLDDWHKVPLSAVKMLHKGTSVVHQGTFIEFVASVFPEHNWNLSQKPHNHKHQTHLKLSLEELFPGVEIQENYRTLDLVYSKTGMMIELDLFIPSLSLAFEYQGEQHYLHKDFHSAANEKRHQRDQEKKEACKRVGITLIEVPFWWNRLKESLAASIHSQRPELMTQFADCDPIPIEYEIHGLKLALEGTKRCN